MIVQLTLRGVPAVPVDSMLKMSMGLSITANRITGRDTI